MAKTIITLEEFKKCSQELRNLFLKEATTENNQELIDFALTAGANPSEGMLVAVDRNDIELLNFFIEKGADVSYKNNCAFSYAACNGNVELAQFLIDLGATPRIDILHAPLNDGHYKIFKLKEDYYNQSKC